MKYIRKYKTIKKYSSDIENEELVEGKPYVSYVETNLKNGDDVLYGIEYEDQNNLTMWIDDYPVAIETEIANVHGFNTINDYLQNLVATGGVDGKYDGANKYIYTGETIEYVGNTYYLWEMQGGEYPYSSIVTYALTQTADFNELYNLSIEKNVQNRNCPVYAFLDEDKSTYKVTNYNDTNYVLLKVEKLQN